MKQNEIILFIIIISGFISFVMTYNIFIQDKLIIDSFEKDILKIRLYNMYENKFNYLHGLYLTDFNPPGPPRRPGGRRDHAGRPGHRARMEPDRQVDPA